MTYKLRQEILQSSSGKTIPRKGTWLNLNFVESYQKNFNETKSEEVLLLL